MLMVKSRPPLDDDDDIQIGPDFRLAHFRVNFVGLYGLLIKVEGSSDFGSMPIIFGSHSPLLLTSWFFVSSLAEWGSFHPSLLDKYNLYDRDCVSLHRFFRKNVAPLQRSCHL